MSELAQPQEIKTELINSASHLRNDARIKADEEELERLKAIARGEVVEDETPQEEASEAEPDGEAVESEPVQAESDSKQEEEPQAKAQEETELSSEEKTFKQRYSDIRKHMQEKDKEFKEKLEKLEKQLDLATKNELVLPKSEDEVEAWAKQYPDVAGIVEAIADKKAQERAAELDSRLAEIESMRSNAKREKAEAELAKLHPDFDDIRSDDAFHKWAESQPKVIQDALYENEFDAKSTARVIDLYKTDKGITKKKASAPDKGAASSVTTKRTTTPEADERSKYLSESMVANMSIKEYEKRADEIMEAQRSGKFVYDMTRR
mgnify:CR=1 FL=1